jgi:hypothetical protein
MHSNGQEGPVENNRRIIVKTRDLSKYAGLIAATVLCVLSRSKVGSTASQVTRYTVAPQQTTVTLTTEGDVTGKIWDPEGGYGRQ